jgi:YHS domain-containing protein
MLSAVVAEGAMRIHCLRIFLVLAVVGISWLTFSPVATGEIVSPVPGKRVALSGYDPVAYFTKGQPERGSSEFWSAFDDAIYLFASSDHRAMFAKEPERFAPQYTGYCTMFLAFQGTKLEPDPEAWAIHEGKLYVFGKKIGAEKFRADAAAITAKANAAWPGVRVQQRECRLIDPTAEHFDTVCKTD